MGISERKPSVVGLLLHDGVESADLAGGFCTHADLAVCRRIHRKYGSTYYFSTLRLPKTVRWRTHALYAFVRIADEWVDNPGPLAVDDRRERLRGWRNQLLKAVDGVPPAHPVMRAFADVLMQTRMPIEEPLLFLDSMEMDLARERYATFDDLRCYMRGSAASVGVMMCHVLGAAPSEMLFRAARALGEAMQLTNFLRDVGEDALRGRIYIPIEDLNAFEVRASDILDRRVTPEFREMMKFQIARAHALYEIADDGIPQLPRESQRGVTLARILYSQILDKLERQQYNPFIRRARTTKLEKLLAIASLSIWNASTQ
jgi:phytoene synthase